MEVLGPLAGLAHRLSAQMFGPNELRFWLSLAGALVAIDLFYRCGNRSSSESFWSYAPWRIYIHASAVLDFKFLFVRKVITAVIIAPTFISVLTLGNWGSKILALWLGPRPGWKASSAALVGFAALGLLLF